MSFSLVKSDFFFMSSFYIGFFHWDHLAHLSHNCLLSFVYITSPYQFIHISCTLHLFPLIFSLSLNSSVRCHSCILTLHMHVHFFSNLCTSCPFYCYVAIMQHCILYTSFIQSALHLETKPFLLAEVIAY